MEVLGGGGGAATLALPPPWHCFALSSAAGRARDGGRSQRSRGPPKPLPPLTFQLHILRAAALAAKASEPPPVLTQVHLPSTKYLQMTFPFLSDCW